MHVSPLYRHRVAGVKAVIRTLGVIAIAVGLTLGIGPWIVIGPPQDAENVVSCILVMLTAASAIVIGFMAWVAVSE